MNMDKLGAELLNYSHVPILLKSKELTAGEKLYLEFHYGMVGGFYHLLFQAIAVADMGNKDKLAKGFPEEVAAYICWTQGSLYERCKMIVAHQLIEKVMENPV